MSDVRKRNLVLSSFFIPVLLLAAACAGSTSTTEEPTPVADASTETQTVSEAASAPAPEPVETVSKSTPKSAPKPAPEPAPEPRFVTVNVPAGTELEVELADPLSSGTNQIGDPVRARLVSDLVVGGRRVAPAGASMRGSVTAVEPLKKFGGQPKIAVAFESLDVEGGETIQIFGSLNAAGGKQAGKDAAKIGGGAAAGAVLGHQIDDKDGSKIGALVGGAIGTAIAAKTGKELELPAGEVVLVVLESEARVRVEG